MHFSLLEIKWHGPYVWCRDCESMAYGLDLTKRSQNWSKMDFMDKKTETMYTMGEEKSVRITQIDLLELL